MYLLFMEKNGKIVDSFEPDFCKTKSDLRDKVDYYSDVLFKEIYGKPKFTYLKFEKKDLKEIL